MQEEKKIENNNYDWIVQKLLVLEQHIINLIIPIQQANRLFGSPELVRQVLEKLSSPIRLNLDPLEKVYDQIMHAAGQMEKTVEKASLISSSFNLEQTLSEIKYIGKRLNEIENILSELKKTGIEKTVEISVSVDGTKHLVPDPESFSNELLFKELCDSLTPKQSKFLLEIVSQKGNYNLIKMSQNLEMSKAGLHNIKSTVRVKLRSDHRKEIIKKITDP